MRMPHATPPCAGLSHAAAHKWLFAGLALQKLQASLIKGQNLPEHVLLHSDQCIKTYMTMLKETTNKVTEEHGCVRAGRAACVAHAAA